MASCYLSLLFVIFFSSNVNSSCNNAIASLQWKVAQLETNVASNINNLMQKLNELETTLLQRLETTSFANDSRNYTQLIKRKRRIPGKFVGCFKGRQGNPMFRGHITLLRNNSVDTCVEICRQNLFMYAATYREYCSCGNAYPNLKPNMFDKMVDGRCNYACDGNATQKCGGEWPLKSVYETGIERKIFDTFSVKFEKKIVCLPVKFNFSRKSECMCVWQCIALYVHTPKCKESALILSFLTQISLFCTIFNFRIRIRQRRKRI